LATGRDFSDEILECCQFAAECRRNADEADDLSRKQFWLDMECAPGDGREAYRSNSHAKTAKALGLDMPMSLLMSD